MIKLQGCSPRKLASPFLAAALFEDGTAEHILGLYSLILALRTLNVLTAQGRELKPTRR